MRPFFGRHCRVVGGCPRSACCPVVVCSLPTVAFLWFRKMRWRQSSSLRAWGNVKLRRFGHHPIINVVWPLLLTPNSSNLLVIATFLLCWQFRLLVAEVAAAIHIYNVYNGIRRELPDRGFPLQTGADFLGDCISGKCVIWCSSFAYCSVTYWVPRWSTCFTAAISIAKITKQMKQFSFCAVFRLVNQLSTSYCAREHWLFAMDSTEKTSFISFMHLHYLVLRVSVEDGWVSYG